MIIPQKVFLGEKILYSLLNKGENLENSEMVPSFKVIKKFPIFHSCQLYETLCFFPQSHFQDVSPKSFSGCFSPGRRGGKMKNTDPWIIMNKLSTILEIE